MERISGLKSDGGRFWRFESESVFKGDVGRGLTLLVGDVGVCAEAGEGSRDGDILLFHGEQERGVAMMILLLGVEMQLSDEKLDDWGGSSFRCEMDGVSTFVVDGVGIGVELDQKFEYVDIAVWDGKHEWGDALVVL